MKNAIYSRQLYRQSRILLLMPALYLSSCVGARVSPLSVEVCTAGRGGTKVLVDDLRYVAEHHGLTFDDTSSETRSELRAIDSGRPIKYGIDKTVALVLKRGSDAKVVVSNLGLPDNQVLISFFYNTKPSGDKATAHQIVQYVRSRYKTEQVPAGHGALGMKSCG